MMNGCVTLMHGNVKVAYCYINKEGYLSEIRRVMRPEHLPVIAQKNTLQNLQRWMLQRLPDKTRKDISELRDFYGTEITTPMNYASLFDAYWFCEDKEEWDDINFFEHYDIEQDTIACALLTPHMITRRNVENNSPILTLPGKAERYWHREDETIFLLYQDAKKEIEDFRIGEQNGIQLEEKEYFLYEDQLFTKKTMPMNKNTECIPLEEYYVLFDKSKKCSRQQNLIACFEHFQVPDWKEFLNQMLKYDELIENDNRDLKDVGVIRDSNTLEIQKLILL